MWHFIGSALAQDPALVMPPIPVGVAPIAGWIMTAAWVVIAMCLPVFLAFVKQKISADATKDNHDMIHDAITRGAALGAKDGTTESHAVDIAVAYAKNHVSDAIAATPQATDINLADSARAILPPLLQPSAVRPPPFLTGTRTP
jgi:hypothetical protein